MPFKNSISGQVFVGLLILAGSWFYLALFWTEVYVHGGNQLHSYTQTQLHFRPSKHPPPLQLHEMIPTQSPVLDNLGSFPGPLSSRCSLTSTFCQRRHLLTVLTPPISSTALGRSICVCVCLYRMEEARKGLFPIFRYLTAAIWLTTSRGESRSGIRNNFNLGKAHPFMFLVSDILTEN